LLLLLLSQLHYVADVVDVADVAVVAFVAADSFNAIVGAYAVVVVVTVDVTPPVSISSASIALIISNFERESNKYCSVRIE
jgi:hypothetical protein